MVAFHGLLLHLHLHLLQLGITMISMSVSAWVRQGESIEAAGNEFAAAIKTVAVSGIQIPTVFRV
jgi:hypothetical protein